MTSTLLIFQIVLSLVITVTVLLQKSSSIGLGAYSGSNETMFGAKGPAGFLAKFTFTLAILFIINTLALGYFYNKENAKSVVSKIQSDVPSAPVSKPETTTAPTAPAPTKVEEPVAPAPVETKAPTTPAVEKNVTVESNETVTKTGETNTTTPVVEEINTTVSESNTSNETNASN